MIFYTVTKCVLPHWRSPYLLDLAVLIGPVNPDSWAFCTCLQTPFLSALLLWSLSTFWVLLCFGVNGRLQRSNPFCEYLDL